MAIPFTTLIKLSAHDFVVLYSGKLNGLGVDFFSYILCGKDGYIKIQRDIENKNICHNLAEYGEVIYTDFKPEPDVPAKAFLDEWLKNRK
jgi:hypothetical protein